jgi:hypothetical protein
MSLSGGLAKIFEMIRSARLSKELIFRLDSWPNEMKPIKNI